MGPRKDKGKEKMVEPSAKRKRETRNPSRRLVIREPQQDDVPRPKAQAQSPSAISYPEVEFSSDEQRAKFEKFMNHEVIPSKFFDHETLRTLGLFDGIQDICNKLCMGRMFNMSYNPVPRLCYEFFSSFEELRGDDGLPLLSFRLMNRDVQLSFNEFCNLFGMKRVQGFVNRNALMTAAEFWFRLTGEENVNTSRMNISHVQHPVYRLMLKWFGACILGKKDYHLTRSVDVLILAQIQRRDTFSSKRVPLAIIKNFKSTAEKEKNIVCGGLITHIAATLPQIGYVYNEPIRNSSLMNISFLTNARDIGVSDRSAPGAKVYKWILHPPSDYKDKPEIRLPLGSALDNLAGRDHYCLREALPEPILKKFGPMSSSDSEEESEESGDEAGNESDGPAQERVEERVEGVGSLNAGANEDVVMAEGGPSSEMGDLMDVVQSRAPSPRVSSRPPSATASQQPPLPRISPPTSFHSRPPSAQPQALSPHNQPLPPPPPHPQPGFADFQAYFDQKFDILLSGQQDILQSMASMQFYQEQQFESINDQIQALYHDHSQLFITTQETESKVDELWGFFHQWPRHDDGNWSPWPEPGQARGNAAPGFGNVAAEWRRGPNDYNAEGPSGDNSDNNDNQGQIWGENSDASFHPPDDWY